MFCLIFATALLFCASAEDSLKEKFLEAVEPRMLGMAMKIQKATEKLEKLREKLDDAEKYDLYDKYEELVARVDKAEGNDCPGWNFQCGGHSRQCISHLLVCDGHNDCDNDADETASICSSAPIASGRIFDGHVHWHSCLVRDDHPVTLVITSVTKKSYFSPRAKVIAKISADTGDDKHFGQTRGYYNFGTRTLVLFPEFEDAKHRMAVCTFDLGDDDHASCVFQMRASETPCAVTVLAARH